MPYSSYSRKQRCCFCCCMNQKELDIRGGLVFWSPSRSLGHVRKLTCWLGISYTHTVYVGQTIGTSVVQEPSHDDDFTHTNTSKKTSKGRQLCYMFPCDDCFSSYLSRLCNKSPYYLYYVFLSWCMITWWHYLYLMYYFHSNSQCVRLQFFMLNLQYRKSIAAGSCTFSDTFLETLLKVCVCVCVCLQ